MDTKQNNEEDRSYKVYVHTNKVNGKKYVGLTRLDIRKRWQNGKGYTGSVYFFRAIKKYGWNGFKHEVVYENLTKEEASEMEKKLVKEYNTTDRDYGYNILEGGLNGNIYSVESRKKISEKLKGKKMSSEKYKKCKVTMFKKGQIPWNKGKKGYYTCSEEVRKKISERNKGKVVSEETRKKISESNKGRVISEETRKKISESNKGQIPWNKGLSMSPEQYEKCKPTMFKKGGEPTNKRKIKCIETGILYNSLKEASRIIGVPSSSLCGALKGKYKTSGGYHWMYLEDYERKHNDNP